MAGLSSQQEQCFVSEFVICWPRRRTVLRMQACGLSLSIVGSYLKSSRNKSNAHWTKVLIPVNYAICVSLWLCIFLSTQKARRCSIKTPSPGHWLVVGREPRRSGRCVEALQEGAWNHMFLSTATWRCFVWQISFTGHVDELTVVVFWHETLLLAHGRFFTESVWGLRYRKF